jgi:hypothetical protein
MFVHRYLYIDAFVEPKCLIVQCRNEDQLSTASSGGNQHIDDDVVASFQRQARNGVLTRPGVPELWLAAPVDVSGPACPTR